MKMQDGFQYNDLTNSLVTNKNITIVASKWNDEIVSKMINESLKHLDDLNVSNVEVLRVPGAWEIPFGCLKAIERGADGIIAFGAIIKGETPHFDFISQATTDAIMKLSVESKKPIGNGIITCLNMKQAQARKKKGREAAQAVISVLSQK